MSKLVSAYKCDYCHKCFGRKCNAEQHEGSCNNNPIRRHCRTCVHGISAIIMWTGWPDADQPIYGPWCDHHDKGMEDKPYFIDCDMTEASISGLYEEGEPREIPGTCDHYRYKGYAGWTKEGEEK